MYVQYTVAIVQLLFLIVLALPFAGTLAVFHVRNYCLGKTTNERFSKKTRRQSMASVSDMTSVTSYRESMVGLESEAEKLYRK